MDPEAEAEHPTIEAEIEEGLDPLDEFETELDHENDPYEDSQYEDSESLNDEYENDGYEDEDEEEEFAAVAASGDEAEQATTPTEPGPSLRNRLTGLLAARYGDLPIWLLMAQCFLTVGWLRATVAHSISPGWRDGSEVDAFRLEHRNLAIDWYRETVFDGLLEVGSGPIAIGVLIAQLSVVVCLALNWRVLTGLGIGAFLNANFLLAGAIDPSTFYLIISAAIALWHIERFSDPARSWRLTLISTIVGFTLIGALAPQVATLDPASVIEDPAVVLMFITLLWTGALWLTFHRHLLVLRSEKLAAMQAADPDDPAIPDTVATSTAMTTIELIAGSRPVDPWDTAALEPDHRVST